MSEAEPGTTRPYKMQARAQAAAATRERILEAAEREFDADAIDEVTLAAIADRSGVSVQTVLRHFGSKEEILAETLMRADTEMRNFREAMADDEPEDGVTALVGYFDAHGDRILRLIAARDRHPTLRALTEFAWSQHQKWCERVFSVALDGLAEGVNRKRRIAQLHMITGVHMWNTLRRHHQLSRRQTELAMREMLDPLLNRSS